MEIHDEPQPTTHTNHHYFLTNALTTTTEHDRVSALRLLCGAILAEYDVQEDWTFSIGWLPSTKGALTKFHPTDPTVMFSDDLFNTGTESEIADVILHELAHIITGEPAGHNEEWQQIFRNLGGSGDRYAKPPIAETARPGNFIKINNNNNSDRRNNK